MPAKKTTSGTRSRAKAKSGARAKAQAEPSPLQPGFAPECLACPFGVFFYTLRNTRPEAMEHIMKAGFELFQAFKAVMESTAERWEQAKTLERIPIS